MPAVSTSQVAQVAVASASTAETRTPGSSYILPANPFMDVDDASLETLVDDGWFEPRAAVRAAPVKQQLAAMAPQEPAVLVAPAVAAPGPTMLVAPAPAVLVAPAPAPAASATAAAIVPTPVAPMPVAPIASMPIAPMFAAGVETTPGAQRVEPLVPMITRRPRRQLLSMLAMMVIVGGAVAGVTAMSRETTSTRPIATPATPTAPTAPTVAPTAPTAPVETAPVKPVAPVAPAPVEVAVAPKAPPVVEPPAPAVAAKIHAVLIRTYPNAAHVTVDGRSFGTTPTYVKIPANTPVEVHITRPGFRSVTRVVTSKRRFDNVFVPLQRTRAKAKKRGVDLSDI